MLLFYVRHGEPIYEPDSLTEVGAVQAEALSKRLSRCGIDRIFASTSNRAIMTAQPTADKLGKDITLLDFCNEKYVWDEFSVPDEEWGSTWAFFVPEYKKMFAERSFAFNEKWYEDERLADLKFRDGMERIDRCTDEWMLSLGYRHDRKRRGYIPTAPTEDRIALFAHQGFGLAFLSSLLDIPYPAFSCAFDLRHTDLTVIEFKTEDGLIVPKVLTLANDAHLYSEGMSKKF